MIYVHCGILAKQCSAKIWCDVSSWLRFLSSFVRNSSLVLSVCNLILQKTTTCSASNVLYWRRGPAEVCSHLFPLLIKFPLPGNKYPSLVFPASLDLLRLLHILFVLASCVSNILSWVFASSSWLLEQLPVLISQRLWQRALHVLWVLQYIQRGVASLIWYRLDVLPRNCLQHQHSSLIRRQRAPTWLYNLLSQSAFKRNATSRNSSACASVYSPHTSLTEAEVAISHSQLCSGVPVESRVWTVFIVILVAGTLALTAIALRIYSRYTIAQYLGADDWTMVLAGSLLIALIVLQVIGMPNPGLRTGGWFDLDGLIDGTGRHIWDVSPSLIVPALNVRTRSFFLALLPFWQRTQVFYILGMLYVTITALIKVSILLFYASLPAEHRIIVLTAPSCECFRMHGSELQTSQFWELLSQAGSLSSFQPSFNAIR